MKKLLLASLTLTLLGGMSYAVDYARQKEDGFNKFEEKLNFKNRGSDNDGAVKMGSFKGGKFADYTGKSNLGPKSLKGSVPSISEDGAGKRKPSLGDKVKGFAGEMRGGWNELPFSGKVALGGMGVMVAGAGVFAAGIIAGSTSVALIGAGIACIGEGTSLAGGKAWFGH
ncbi:MAG: hypothetical protein PHP45_09770 [Elusimicrobiales bacterium]|nr:hypothetical protein [Elusimicrobiales bacterium]